MIGDVSRTGTYRKAILGNAAAAIRDKVVLDVGAGTSLNLMELAADLQQVPVSYLTWRLRPARRLSLPSRRRAWRRRFRLCVSACYSG